MKHYILGTVAALALAGAAEAQQRIVIGTTTSATSHYGVGAEAFIAKLAELSDGAFVGEQAPAGQLGGERDLIEGLQIGSVDMAISSSGPLGNFVPEVFALDLPFLFRDYDHARKVLDGEIGQELLAKVDENNLVGLAWAENGFRHVTNSQRPILTPEDLGGIKLRTMENRVHMAAFTGMGASPTPMAFPELFGALQQGVVDGQENPITVITASKFWEVQKYVSLTGHVYSPAIILASPALIDGLTEEQKGWFYEAAKVGVEANRAEVNRLEAEGVALLRENGMEVITDIDKAPFAALAEESAYAVYTDEYGTEMIDRIKAVE
ncbi:TRAP transporter substrate-binding protein [Szabonella alba]|uniref:TRAP transporter substrate-binding protein n=1 Tax=Szabonella alba TaxID=2804194 RepID=A0A8K0VB52_9RHOB|nr:TRAP transporter substrate-binding protein [Szabonella alba]MBL4918683.1 TRAP transporter substrate-binding protein [Szabonella alba]